MFLNILSKCPFGPQNNGHLHSKRTTCGWSTAMLLAAAWFAAMDSSVALRATSLRYTWGVFDFELDDALKRQLEESGTYAPANTTPFDVDVDPIRNRVLLALPSVLPGARVTLATIKDVDQVDSPLLVPYPDWSWHSGERGCEGLTSVFRIYVDSCRRLWAIDSGIVDVANTFQAKCPAQLFVFNLDTDELLERHVLDVPDSAKATSLILNVVTEQVGRWCDDDAYAYIADAGAYALYVYSLRERRSWRVQNDLFLPGENATQFFINGSSFTLNDGVLGLAQDCDYLYFHGFASFDEGRVLKSVLREEYLVTGDTANTVQGFQSLGSRSSQSAGEVMTNDGVLLFHQMGTQSLYCWESSTEYTRSNIKVVEQDEDLLHFVTTVKLVETFGWFRKYEFWAIDNNGQRLFAGEFQPNLPNTVNVVVGLADHLTGQCRRDWFNWVYNVFWFYK